MVSAACLVLSSDLWAQEKFEARLLAEPGETPEQAEKAKKFEISIDSYTSVEEVTRLKEIFHNEGYESFMSAFREMNKGTLSPVGGRGVKIAIHAAHSTPTDKGRKILLFTSSQSWDVDTPRIIDWRFPFMLIELDIGHKGKGKGKIYEQVSIKLDPEGNVAMHSYNSPPLSLWGVRALTEPKRDVVSEGAGKFRGPRFGLEFSGGGSFFDCGDFDRGSRGEFETRVEDIVAEGFTIQQERPESLSSGLEIAADLIYQLTPRIGASLGIDVSRSKPESLLLFYEIPGLGLHLSSAPTLKTIFLSLGIVYGLPVSRLFSFYVNGGVCLYQADYKLALNLLKGYENEDFGQSAKGQGFGVYGGSGFELALNPKVSLFIEARGRYAWLGGFEGSESFQRYPGTESYKREGTLYYLESGAHPRLAILESEPAGGRKAVLDLRSLSLLAGLKFKF